MDPLDPVEPVDPVLPVEPDVPVEAKDLTPEEMREAMKDSDSDIANPKLDNQLMKAIQVVLSKSR